MSKHNLINIKEDENHKETNILFFQNQFTHNNKMFIAISCTPKRRVNSRLYKKYCTDRCKRHPLKAHMDKSLLRKKQRYPKKEILIFLQNIHMLNYFQLNFALRLNKHNARIIKINSLTISLAEDEECNELKKQKDAVEEDENGPKQLAFDFQ